MGPLRSDHLLFLARRLQPYEAGRDQLVQGGGGEVTGRRAGGPPLALGGRNFDLGQEGEAGLGPKFEPAPPTGSGCPASRPSRRRAALAVAARDSGTWLRPLREGQDERHGDILAKSQVVDGHLARHPVLVALPGKPLGYIAGQGSEPKPAAKVDVDADHRGDGLTKTYRVFQKKEGLLGRCAGLYRREYKEVRAVDGVSFTIEPGEMVAFLGPNGAGKTTTLKMLSGLIYPTSGTARVLGFVPWERADAFRRQFALVMGQKNQLWWDLPAADSFQLHREIYSLPAAEFQPDPGRADRAVRRRAS